jgi:hypothetical protein
MQSRTLVTLCAKWSYHYTDAKWLSALQQTHRHEVAVSAAVFCSCICGSFGSALNAFVAKLQVELSAHS